MPEQIAKTLNHFVSFRFSADYFQLNTQERQQIHVDWLSGLRQAGTKVEVYATYPAQVDSDVMVWSAMVMDESCTVQSFFDRYARATNPYRRYIEPSNSFWGFTRPSQYTKTRSTQEIDPFSEQRKPYLVMYPFVKTVDWYLMSRDARQGMMNEHIRIGKQYPEITQLLLYSFGLQDQEFIVIYEMDDLVQFSDLVYELRSSEARRYTDRDTPLITAIFHPAEETLAAWEAGR